jgi:hypothetical protein
MKVVWLPALSSCRLYPSGNTPGTHISYRLSRPECHSAAGRIMSMKICNDAIGKKTEVFSGFRRQVDENCTLLGYYAASSDNSLPMFRDKLSVPSRVKTPKRMRWKRLEETLLLPSTTTHFQGTQTENTLTHSRLISRHDIFLNRLKLGNAERRQKVLVYPDRISE